MTRKDAELLVAKSNGKLQIGMPVCEVVQIQGGNRELMGIMSINTKRGFWRIVLDVVEFPYKQGKKIFVC